MQDEFNARAETTENKIKLAENAINRLKIGIGDLLLPAVAQGANLFADAIEAIRQKIPALTEKLQGLQPTIDNLKRLFTVLSSAATSVGNTILSSFTGEEVAAVDAFGSESYNGTSLEVNYNIDNITIQGGGENIPSIKQQIKDALRENSEEIVQLINDTIEGNESRRLRLSNS